MFHSDDPAILLGQDISSVVARLAGADRRADPLDLAETRAVFDLVARRAELTLPPIAARSTAGLILGPAGALAMTVGQIDTALSTVCGWLDAHPPFVLRALGKAFDPVDRRYDMLRHRPLDIDAETARALRLEWERLFKHSRYDTLRHQDLDAGSSSGHELRLEWERLFGQSSVSFRLGIHRCCVVACGEALQVRVQDPETSAYLAIAHLPIEPDEDREILPLVPELIA